MAWCFGLDAVSYLFVLGALLAMRTEELHPQPRTTRDRGHLVAGLRYVWGTDELRRPLIVLAVMFTFVFQWQVLMPLLGGGDVQRGGAGVRPALRRRRGRRLRRRDHDGPQATALPACAGSGFFAGWSGRRCCSCRSRRRCRWAMLAMVPVGFAAMCFMITGNTMLQTEREAAGARARDGAVRDRVPRVDAVRRADRRMARPALGPRVEFALMGALAIGVGAAVVLALRRRAQTRDAIDELVAEHEPDAARGTPSPRVRGARSSPAAASPDGRRSRCRPRAAAGSRARSRPAPATGSCAAPHCSAIGAPVRVQLEVDLRASRHDRGSTGVHSRKTAPTATIVAEGTERAGSARSPSAAAISRATL